MHVKDQIISNFWTAVIASVVLTTSALLLHDNDQAGPVIILEGVAFGLRLGDQALKTFNKGECQKIHAQTELEQMKKPA